MNLFCRLIEYELHFSWCDNRGMNIEDRLYLEYYMIIMSLCSFSVFKINLLCTVSINLLYTIL